MHFQDFIVRELGNGSATLSFNHLSYLSESGEYITDVGIEGRHIKTQLQTRQVHKITRML